jgi:hypothetical protein
MFVIGGEWVFSASGWALGFPRLTGAFPPMPLSQPQNLRPVGSDRGVGAFVANLTLHVALRLVIGASRYLIARRSLQCANRFQRRKLTKTRRRSAE